jgi:hypothetical protein
MAIHWTTHRVIYYLHVEQFLAVYADMDFFGYVATIGMLSSSVLDFMVWDGGLPFCGISGGWLYTGGAIARPGTGFFQLILEWFGFITSCSMSRFVVNKNYMITGMLKYLFIYLFISSCLTCVSHEGSVDKKNTCTQNTTPNHITS